MTKSLSYLFNKRELQRLYVAKRMTTLEISKLYNCNDVTIRNYLEKFGIKRRRDSPRYLCTTKKLTKIQASYLAGIIDGEGTITIAKSTRSVGGITTLLSVANTDFNLIKWLIENVGGRSSSYQPRNKNWNVKHTWVITSVADVQMILKLVYPYLIIKKQNAKKVLDFCKWRIKISQESRKKAINYARKDNGYDFAKVNQIFYPDYEEILKIKSKRSGVQC